MLLKRAENIGSGSWFSRRSVGAAASQPASTAAQPAQPLRAPLPHAGHSLAGNADALTSPQCGSKPVGRPALARRAWSGSWSGGRRPARMAQARSIGRRWPACGRFLGTGAPPWMMPWSPWTCGAAAHGAGLIPRCVPGRIACSAPAVRSAIVARCAWQPLAVLFFSSAGLFAAAAAAQPPNAARGVFSRHHSCNSAAGLQQPGDTDGPPAQRGGPAGCAAYAAPPECHSNWRKLCVWNLDC